MEIQLRSQTTHLVQELLRHSLKVYFTSALEMGHHTNKNKEECPDILTVESCADSDVSICFQVWENTSTRESLITYYLTEAYAGTCTSPLPYKGLTEAMHQLHIFERSINDLNLINFLRLG